MLDVTTKFTHLLFYEVALYPGVIRRGRGRGGVVVAIEFAIAKMSDHSPQDSFRRRRSRSIVQDPSADYGVPLGLGQAAADLHDHLVVQQIVQDFRDGGKVGWKKDRMAN